MGLGIIKYDESVKLETATILKNGERLASAHKAVNLSKNTNLPAAKKFATTENTILNILASMSQVVAKDVNDANATFQSIEKNERYTKNNFQ